MKMLIFVNIKDNADKSGIYRWTHIYNGKSYLGSSSNLKKTNKDFLITIITII
jgi:hypothetical protein